MSLNINDRRFNRRGAFKLGAGAALVAGGAGLVRSAGTARAAGTDYIGSPGEINLIATDGWVGFPQPQNPTKYFPDTYAPDPRTTYLFGFRDVTQAVRDYRVSSGNSQAIATDVPAVLAQKGRTQACAPLIYVDEGDDVTITLSNLGFQQRPDLTDGHTIHWHGFRNALSMFDGIPEMSISVPDGRTFPYFYRPVNPGTYIYHCHFEDVEHVQMGMTGVVFVRPKQNGSSHGGFTKFAYNDAQFANGLAGSTGYDREFAILITEWYLQSHWEDAHIQQPLWDQYTADMWMLNGRTYPDTLQPTFGYDATTLAPAPPGSVPGRLAYQPVSSLIEGNAGERVLVRMANLGYQQHSMTLPGLPMRVVGKDATLLAGRDGTDLSYTTDTVDIGPGEGVDVVVTIPDPGSSSTAYPLYDRAYANGYLIQGGGMHAGMRTEVRAHPAGTLGPQTTPNA